MRRGKTKEEQVDLFNAKFSAPVVTYISEDDFRCEYCSALTRKPKILHFHPKGKGDPIAGHHTQHNNHRGKLAEIEAWCEARKQHVIRDGSGALTQGSLQGFFRPAAPTPQLHATKLSETVRKHSELGAGRLHTTARLGNIRKVNRSAAATEWWSASGQLFEGQEIHPALRRKEG